MTSNRKKRLDAILDIIDNLSSTDFTQQFIMDELYKLGIDIVQSTCSRDLDYLGYTKAKGTGQYTKKISPLAQLERDFLAGLIKQGHLELTTYATDDIAYEVIVKPGYEDIIAKLIFTAFSKTDTEKSSQVNPILGTFSGNGIVQLFFEHSSSNHFIDFYNMVKG